MSDYTKQAEQFLADTQTEFSIVYLYTGPHFDDDKESRDVYQFTLKNARGIYSAKFGDSTRNTERRAFANAHGAWGVRWCKDAARLGFKKDIGDMVSKKSMIEARGHKPSAYDVLACLTSYGPGTFADFCGDFGYDTDSIKAQNVYFAVQAEWEGVRRMFTTEQLEQLQEIN